MKNIDVLCLNSINAINGPVTIHVNYLLHSDYFLSRGYKLNVLFKEGFFSEISSSNKKTGETRTTRSSKLRNNIIRVFQKSCILRFPFLLLVELNMAKKIKHYVRANRNPWAVVADSEEIMYYFLKYNDNANIRTILFLHNDGTPLKMFRVSYQGMADNSLIYKLKKRQYLFSVTNVTRLVFICNTARTKFLAMPNSLPSNKVCVILNGIPDIPLANSSEKSCDFNGIYELVCVGSVTQRKGQEIIIRAMSKMDKNLLEKVHLSIIGAGPALDNLLILTKKMRLDDKVSFVGPVNNSHINDYLLRSNIFILMSVDEGLPMSIIEAMRAGLPIISTPVAGIPELVVDHINGLLLRPCVDDLKVVLNRIDKYDWSCMGKESRKIFVSEFTLDRMMCDYCGMLDEIV